MIIFWLLLVVFVQVCISFSIRFSCSAIVFVSFCFKIVQIVLSALEGGNGASEGPYGLGASHYRRPVHVYGLTVSLSIMVDHIEHHRRNVSSAIML